MPSRGNLRSLPRRHQDKASWLQQDTDTNPRKVLLAIAPVDHPPVHKGVPQMRLKKPPIAPPTVLFQQIGMNLHGPFIPQVDTGKSVDSRRDGLSHPTRRDESPPIRHSSGSRQVLHSVHRSPSRRSLSPDYGPRSSIYGSADSGGSSPQHTNYRRTVPPANQRAPRV